MTTCPKCGHAGVDDEQCVRCGIIFERMHTVLDHSPVGALAQAARRATQVARAQGTSSVDQSEAPTVEVSTVDLSALSKPAPAAPPVVPLVPRNQPRRRTWLLVVLAALLGLLFLNQRQDRRQAGRQRAEAALLAGRPVVDRAYVDLALESMLGQARTELRRIDEPSQATANLDELLTRVSDLEKRLDGARVVEARRVEYAQALEHLRAFLEEDARVAITAAAAPDARREPVSIRSLEQAEAAFEIARSGQ